jgi:hypothetical protein
MTMLSWFNPKCTVNPRTRHWIEARWQSLGEQFPDLLRGSANVLPTASFFPDRYEPSDDAVRVLVNRVCGYMRVPPARIDLQFYSQPGRSILVNDDGHAIASGAAGTYHESDQQFVIRIERDQFQNPMTLVGTVAHELAHVRLLGERRLDRAVFDNELLTDLTVVYHGMGVFLANVPRHWESQTTTWPDSNEPRPNYMSTPMYKYALALRCWSREEASSKWSRHLRSAPRAEFKTALRFLKQGPRR